MTAGSTGACTTSWPRSPRSRFVPGASQCSSSRETYCICNPDPSACAAGARHLIVTAGAFSQGGARFFRLPRGFLKPLESLVRVRVLSKLAELGLLNEKRCRLLMGWRHSGFSVFAGRPIVPGDDARLARLARYVRRPHLAASKVIYDEGSDRVVFRSANGVHPGFKANFRVFQAEDFVAEVRGFIPPARMHETVAYGEYANVVRGRRKRAQASKETAITEPDPIRVYAAWRHLIKHIYEVDPLACPRCGEEMGIVSIIDQPSVIKRILRHLKLWPPPQRPPKPRRPGHAPAVSLAAFNLQTSPPPPPGLAGHNTAICEMSKVT